MEHTIEQLRGILNAPTIQAEASRFQHGKYLVRILRDGTGLFRFVFIDGDSIRGQYSGWETERDCINGAKIFLDKGDTERPPRDVNWNKRDSQLNTIPEIKSRIDSLYRKIEEMDSKGSPVYYAESILWDKKITKINDRIGALNEKLLKLKKTEKQDVRGTVFYDKGEREYAVLLEKNNSNPDLWESLIVKQYGELGFALGYEHSTFDPKTTGYKRIRKIPESVQKLINKLGYNNLR